MRWLRRILGTNFPDPVAGQVWRSAHSGRWFRVESVELSDCGELWHIDLQHEGRDGEAIPIPQSYCMFPYQWRAMLRRERRELAAQNVPKPAPWPRPAVPSITGKIIELDYTRDLVVIKVADGIAETLPICAQVTLGVPPREIDRAPVGPCGLFPCPPLAYCDRPGCPNAPKATDGVTASPAETFRSKAPGSAQ